MPKAVFFDRDGVLNVDRGYVGYTKDFEWVPGARDAIARFKSHGYLILVVTNQSGVARGYFTENDVIILHEHMQREANGAFDAFHYCPYLPGAPIQKYDRISDLRKPAPGMLLELIERFQIEPDQSVLIGDKDTDIEAAKGAGVEGLLFSGGNLDDFVVEYLQKKGAV